MSTLEFDQINSVTYLEAAIWLFLSQWHPDESNPTIVIWPDSIATEAINKLMQALPHFHVRTLDSLDIVPFKTFEINPIKASQRAGLISSIIRDPGYPIHIITGSWSAFCQRTAPLETWLKACRVLTTGDIIDDNFFNQIKKLGYEKSIELKQPGQWSGLSQLIHIMTPTLEYPVRIKVTDGIIEHIAIVKDSNYPPQLQNVPTAVISPLWEFFFDELDPSKYAQSQSLKNLFSYTEFLEICKNLNHYPLHPYRLWLIPASTLSYEATLRIIKKTDKIWWIFWDDILREWNQLALNFQKHNIIITEYFESPQNLKIQGHKVINRGFVENNSNSSISVQSLGQIFKKNGAYITNAQGQSEWVNLLERFPDTKFIICCKSQNGLSQVAKSLELASIPFGSVDSLWETQSLLENTFQTLVTIFDLDQSFSIPSQGVWLINANELLPKKTSRIISYHYLYEQSRAISDAEKLRPGQYVVHQIHGIGIFDGLTRLTIGSSETEFLVISYQNNDKLYLPVYKIHELNVYYHPNSFKPEIDKLGGTTWAKTQQKIKKIVWQWAEEMLRIEAQRKSLTRPIYKVPDGWNDFLDSFPFTDTPDQEKVTLEILKDMTEKTYPMDRLLSGDVGFGKTEIAMRAAFIAVKNHKQVIVLTPTTVLAMQHHQRFQERFQKFGIKVEAYHRFIDSQKIKALKKDILSGEPLVVIGTHKLLLSDMDWSHLGLLIVDEEQKFGVIQKEKLKKNIPLVDVLTLTATPIPRTLNLALMGIKDFSVLLTAPESRKPIKTQIIHWDLKSLEEVILFELSRNGQVFFVHNRIESLPEIFSELKKSLPSSVRLAMAHGRMKEQDLEKITWEFYQGHYDVLVSTAIIENGLDFPNVNTILIHRPELFGLAQLHQLRGRVGRSHRQAYCYLVLDPEKTLDTSTIERLKILQDNSNIGSGIRIAQMDLEIRGAGSILSTQQHGFMEILGYDAYLQLIQETIQELKGSGQPIQNKTPEIQIIDPCYIDDQVIQDMKIRLYFYRKLGLAKSEEEIDEIEREMAEWTGAPLPEPTVNLFLLHKTRIILQLIQAIRLDIVSKGIRLTFVPDPHHLDMEKMLYDHIHNRSQIRILPDNRILIPSKPNPKISEILILLNQFKSLYYRNVS